MDIHIDDLTTEQLDRLMKMANIAKISAEIKAMRKNHDMQMAELLSKIEASSFNNAKIEAERRKFDAELRFYPWISAGITVLAIFALGMIAKYLGFV